MIVQSFSKTQNFALLLAKYVLVGLMQFCVHENTALAEQINITTEGIWECDPSSTECKMVVDSACGNDCDGSEYHCPNTIACNLCELECNGQNDACKGGTFYSYYCKQVNVYSTVHVNNLFVGMFFTLLSI